MQRRTLLRRIALTSLLASPLSSLAGARKKTCDSGPPEAAAETVAYGRRDDVITFATEFAQQHGLELDWVQDALADARFIPTVARLLMPAPPGTAKNWAAYRARSVETVRIRAGVAFWKIGRAHV